MGRMALLVALGALIPSAAYSNPIAFEIVKIDSGPNDVGSRTSIAIDSQGNPHLACVDRSVLMAKYATHSGGAWSVEVIDVGTLGSAQDLELAVDQHDRPHVAYLNQQLRLSYAVKGGGAWLSEVVTGDGIGAADAFVSLAVDSQGRPHMSYAATYIDGFGWTHIYLKYARKVHGAWRTENIDYRGRSSSTDLGMESVLTLDAESRPHVVYTYSYSTSPPQLLYATKLNSAWHLDLVLGGVTYFAESGFDVTDGGIPHVAKSVPPGTVHYLVRDNGAWTDETVTTFAAGVSTIALVLDDTEQPHLAFSASIPDLMYGTRESGVWRTEIVEPDGVGALRDCRIAVSSDGTLHLTYWNSTTGDWLYAEGMADGATAKVANAGVSPDAANAFDVFPNPVGESGARIVYRGSTEARPDGIHVYDLSGRRVARIRLLGHEAETTWRPTDEAGRVLPAGVYFLRQVTPGPTVRITVVR